MVWNCRKLNQGSIFFCNIFWKPAIMRIPRLLSSTLHRAMCCKLTSMDDEHACFWGKCIPFQPTRGGRNIPWSPRYPGRLFCVTRGLGPDYAFAQIRLFNHFCTAHDRISPHGWQQQDRIIWNLTKRNLHGTTDVFDQSGFRAHVTTTPVAIGYVSERVCAQYVLAWIPALVQPPERSVWFDVIIG